VLSANITAVVARGASPLISCANDQERKGNKHFRRLHLSRKFTLIRDDGRIYSRAVAAAAITALNSKTSLEAAANRAASANTAAVRPAAEGEDVHAGL
jgi:hypothetical protein